MDEESAVPASRRGRPKSGASAWGPFIERCPNLIMRRLANEADARGHTMLGFARVANVDLRALQRYFSAKNPEPKTVRRIVKALGYPAIVGRALSEGLTRSDIANEWKIFAAAMVDGGGFELFGPNLWQAREAFVEALDVNRDAEALVFTVSVLVRHGFWNGPIDPRLGRYFSAIEDTLAAATGRSLRPFMNDEFMLIERKRKAIAELRHALDELGVIDAQKAEVWGVLQTYVAETEAFLEALDTPTGKSTLTQQRSEKDAIREQETRSKHPEFFEYSDRLLGGLERLQRELLATPERATGS